jgi:hypothetical protein
MGAGRKGNLEEKKGEKDLGGNWGWRSGEDERDQYLLTFPTEGVILIMIINIWR